MLQNMKCDLWVAVITARPHTQLKHLDKAVRSASSRTRPRRTTSASPFSAGAPSPSDVIKKHAVFSAVNMMGALKCAVDACGGNARSSLIRARKDVVRPPNIA